MLTVLCAGTGAHNISDHVTFNTLLATTHGYQHPPTPTPRSEVLYTGQHRKVAVRKFSPEDHCQLKGSYEYESGHDIRKTRHYSYEDTKWPVLLRRSCPARGRWTISNCNYELDAA